MLACVFSGVEFDGTITLGSVLSALGYLTLSVIAWRDLTWRIRNLETWRKEFLVDALSREQLESKIDTLVTTLNKSMERPEFDRRQRR